MSRLSLSNTTSPLQFIAFTTTDYIQTRNIKTGSPLIMCIRRVAERRERAAQAQKSHSDQRAISSSPNDAHGVAEQLSASFVFPKD